MGSYDKWFYIKSWQTFVNFLFLYKAQSKNDFLKDVESTVGTQKRVRISHGRRAFCV